MHRSGDHLLPRHGESARLLRMQKSVRDALIAQAEGDPRAQIHLARLLAGGKYQSKAYQLAVRARAAAPDDPEIRRLAQQILGCCVPPGFFQFVRNRVRNEAHAAAIQRAVRPGMRVLEIGTGTGLFAMMAARAGAAEVVTCDMNIAMADTAREIIARNGLADRVRVIGKHSTKLNAADIGGRADVLISEVVTVSLHDDRGRETLQHAVEDLLEPGAPLIPSRATARIALAEDPNLHDFQMGANAGFDLSAFNRLAPPFYLTGASPRGLELRSAPADIFAENFRPPWPPSPLEGVATLTANGGRVDGIVQWALLDLDDVIQYENRPGTEGELGWQPVFYPFDQPRALSPGARITVHARQEGAHLRVCVEDT